jgi:hypothetical protein
MRTSREALWVLAVLCWIALTAQLAGCYYQAASYQDQAYAEQAPQPQLVAAQPAQPEQPAVTATVEAQPDPFAPGATASSATVQPTDTESPFEPTAATAPVVAPPPIASASVEAPAAAPAQVAAPPAAEPQPVAGAQADVVSIPIAARPEFYALLGQAQGLMNAGQYPQALRVLNAARRFSRHPAVLYNMAICLEHMQQFQRAASIYRRVTIDPVLGPRAQERINVLVGSQMVLVR